MKKKTTSRKSVRSRKTDSKSMVDALFTSPQQSLFRLIFGQPQRKFFATELIHLAGKGSGAVQRELAALKESGLINVEITGKQKYDSANTAAPIFHELRAIVLKIVGLIDPLKQALEKLNRSASKVVLISATTGPMPWLLRLYAAKISIREPVCRIPMPRAHDRSNRHADPSPR